MNQHWVAQLRGVSFEFPNGRKIFKNLTLSLGTGIYGLVGPNGIGKTCLAKLLTGELRPTQGDAQRSGTLCFFAQRQTPENISVNEFLGEDLEWSLLREQLLAGIDPAALCTTLSGGQWMRVRLARTLSDSFLILDEPTNDLDREGREALLRYLRGRDGGTLLISHDRECLSLCDEILELSQRGLARFGGGWEAYLDARNTEREGLNRALEVAKKERDRAHADRLEQIARQEKRNRRGAQEAESGSLPRILVGARKRRAQGTSGRIDVATLAQAEKAVQLAHEAFSDLKVDPVMYANLLGGEIPSQKLVAEARGFNICFHDWLYPRDLDFSWRGSVRVALKGKNGSGKSTLLKALLGGDFKTRGELRRGNLKTLYIDQACAQLDDNKTVFENMRESVQGDESTIRNGLAKFLFTKDAAFQKVQDLSGGERLRAALAKGFLGQEKPELLILDEPTNNLDLANIEFLETLVRQFRGALIVISHDEVFLENCGVREALEL